MNYDASIERPRLIHVTNTSDQRDPVSDILPDGRLMILYTSINEDTTPLSIFGVIRDPSLTSAGGNFRINTVTDLRQDKPFIKTLTSERVFVCYRD